MDESAPEIRDREVVLNGSRVHYLTAGDGPPLVLLHGLGDSARDWQWVMPALARRSRVVAPDFPGFGDSDRPRAAYSPGFFAEFVAGFLEALHIPSAVVAGNSLGGLAALRFALVDPARVPALVLVDGAGLGRRVNPGMRVLSLPGLGEPATAFARTRPGRALRLWGRTRSLFAHHRRAPAGWIADQDRLSRRPDFPRNTLEVLRAVVGPSGQREVLRERLPELPMPTLIVWGERDRVIPLAHGRDAVGRLRRGRLAVIPDCGHVPQIERPDLFLEALGSFLDGAIAGAGSDGSHAE